MQRIDALGARRSADQKNLLPQGTLIQLATDSQERVHVLHQTEGVFRYDSGTWKAVAKPTLENAVDMSFLGDDLLVLTEQRLLRFGKKQEELFRLEQ